MQIDPFGPVAGGQKLLPDTNPRRNAMGVGMDSAYIASPDRGSGGVELYPDRIGAWLARWRHWREGFEQRIGPAARRYWALYRNFDEGLNFQLGQEWRDRTVIPESFKIIETRVPRKILGTWGGNEPFAVRGRGYRDESYEEMVKELLSEVLDDIGSGDPRAELFFKRLIDGERYRQIMGHVFWKVWWKTHKDWIHTKIKQQDGKWKAIDVLELLYDNVDIQWCGLDSISLDLSGARRWVIEKLITSVEALREEDDKYKAEHDGQPLYKNLDQLVTGEYATSPIQRDSFEEPRVTERWPLSDGRILSNPGEHQVELWLCWDNVHRTLTKIGNRAIELDHGLAPTPYGYDPFISLPAVPVPNRVYGDSILNWTGPLSRYQTRIARARADEILLNIWQQYIYREGTLRGAQWFWRPGGGMGIEATNDDRPISDHFALLPRRPVFTEAWQEEAYRKNEAEETAAADPLTQGQQATQKSRDVTATEVQQRTLQGATRYELERLYDEVAFKKPLLGMIFDLLRQNLTQPKMVRILDDSEGLEAGDYKLIDLSDLDRPIDIVIGGGVLEISQAEKLQELRELINLDGDPNFSQFINHEKVLLEILKNTRTLSRNSRKFVFTKDQVAEKQAELAAQQAAAAGGTGPTSGGTAPPANQMIPGSAAPGVPGTSPSPVAPPSPTETTPTGEETF